MAADARINTDYERRPYWHATMPALPDRSGRALPDAADAVVIGGGYTGIAAARKLALQGARVVLLEANNLGWGASSRNGGICHPGFKWDPGTLVKKYGRELAHALYAETVEATNLLEGIVRDQKVDAELRYNGYLVLAWARSHAEGFADEVADLAEVGTPSRVIPRDQLSSEIGSNAYHGGLAIDAGGVIHPGKWFAASAALAERAGAELHEGVRATSIRRQADGRFVVETKRGAIHARDVLVATNGYTDGVAPTLRRRIIPIGSYIVATEPLSESLAKELSPTGRAYFDTRNFLSYWHAT
ncbi:MAG: FAD-dependent oxidoreductase, partial [Chloroflexota bacterium]